MTSSKDSEKHFPRLHIHILKSHAERWIKKFPEAPVKRILLYSIHFESEGCMPYIIESYKPNPAIYAVVFEVDEEDKTINMTPEEQMEYDILCIRRQAALHLDMETNERLLLARQHPLESYERLLLATQPNLKKSDFKNLTLKYLHLVTADFANVYKRPAKDNYLEEWRFIVKFKNTELNADIRTDEPFAILALRPKSKQFENLTASKKDHKFSDYYQQLNLPELKIMAEGWADRFSVIKQLVLYRDRDEKYVLDVRIDDSDKIEYRSFEEYWIDKACYLDRLRDVYKEPTESYGEWLFRLPEVGGQPLSKDDQVLTDSRLILFSRDDVDEADLSEPQKLRPNQQDKFDCQKIAKETWDEYPILDIVHMIKLPAIKIVGKHYAGRNTLRNWLKEVAPKRAKQPGKRSRETLLEQKKICKKLGIEHKFEL